MSTQYDNIGESYNIMRNLPYSLLLDANIKEVVTPYLQNARVLDLACGTGFYTKEFLNWGAKSTLGVDISTAMIDAARTSSSSSSSSSSFPSDKKQQQQQPSFRVGDCSQPQTYYSSSSSEPFDLVFAAWLLNYAPTATSLTAMFRTAHLNLCPGGYFIAITSPPTSNPRAHTEAQLLARAKRTGIVVTSPLDVDDGVTTHIVISSLESEGGEEKFSFDAYHLKKEVYERAAREAGFGGKVRWIETRIPEGEGFRGDLPGVEGLGWGTYLDVPHWGMLIVVRE